MKAEKSSAVKAMVLAILAGYVRAYIIPALDYLSAHGILTAGLVDDAVTKEIVKEVVTAIVAIGVGVWIGLNKWYQAKRENALLAMPKGTTPKKAKKLLDAGHSAPAIVAENEVPKLQPPATTKPFHSLELAIAMHQPKKPVAKKRKR